MIQVLIADSSAVVRSVLKEIILKNRKLEWVGEAFSYRVFKNEVQKLKPDIVIMNLSIFDSSTDSLITDYCRNTEIPSIIYYSPGQKSYSDSKNVKFLELPNFMNFSAKKMEEYSSFLDQLIFEIKCSALYEKHLNTDTSPIKNDGSYEPVLNSLPKAFSDRKFKAVLIGVSTGGPGALLELINSIGKNYPLPIFITQHIDSFFDKNLITWLRNESSVPIHLAENDIKALAGHVYFAPSDAHLTFKSNLEDGFHIILNHDQPVNFLRPAVDKMFESAAKVFGKNCIAVILTGMGADGAKECLHLKETGAYTITQDESSCVIYGMPKAAFEMGASCEVLPLKQIAERLWSLTGSRK
ncbi:MAG: hypothetical protein K5829_12780 [Treponema sp.]|nr:hypothetical protein [Treponema sp.]